MSEKPPKPPLSHQEFVNRLMREAGVSGAPAPITPGDGLSKPKWAAADFEFAGRSEYWKTEEGIAYSLGVMPDSVPGGRVDGFSLNLATAKIYSQIDETAAEFLRRYELRMRSGGSTLTQPSAYIAWLDQKGFTNVPTALRESVKRYTPVPKPDWQALYEQQRSKCLQLEEQQKLFDPDSDCYPERLDVAYQAWRAISNGQGDQNQTVMTRIRAWIDANYPESKFKKWTNGIRESMAQTASWDMRPGRRRRGE